MNKKIKSSAPGAFKMVIKPVCDAMLIDMKVNTLLDFYEESEDSQEREKAYSRALNLAKKSNKLLGYIS